MTAEPWEGSDDERTSDSATGDRKWPVIAEAAALKPQQSCNVVARPRVWRCDLMQTASDHRSVWCAFGFETSEVTKGSGKPGAGCGAGTALVWGEKVMGEKSQMVPRRSFLHMPHGHRPRIHVIKIIGMTVSCVVSSMCLQPRRQRI